MEYAGLSWPPSKDITGIAQDAYVDLLKQTRQMRQPATYAKVWEGF